MSSDALPLRSFGFRGVRYRLLDDPVVRARDLQVGVATVTRESDGEIVVVDPRVLLGLVGEPKPLGRPYVFRQLIEDVLVAGFDDAWLAIILDGARRLDMIERPKISFLGAAVAPATRAALDRLTGRGIEIGAFQSPLPVPPHVHVTYADVIPAATARRYYEEVPLDVAIVEPDIVAPAHDLPLAECSLDFVLASHLIEHLPDPLAGLIEWHRVLRPHGLLLLVVPDRRGSADVSRPRTDLPHLLADHAQGPDHPERIARDHEHYRSWARSWNALTDPRQVEFWASGLERVRYPIHFHCWHPEDFPPILEHLASTGVSFATELAAAREDGYEFLLLLRKTSTPST